MLEKNVYIMKKKRESNFQHKLRVFIKQSDWNKSCLGIKSNEGGLTVSLFSDNAPFSCNIHSVQHDTAVYARTVCSNNSMLRLCQCLWTSDREHRSYRVLIRFAIYKFHGIGPTELRDCKLMQKLCKRISWVYLFVSTGNATFLVLTVTIKLTNGWRFVWSKAVSSEQGHNRHDCSKQKLGLQFYKCCIAIHQTLQQARF